MEIKDFYTMEAMRYYSNDKDCQSRRDMISNKDNQYIASEKHDGCWSMLIHERTGVNHIRSRAISKITGEYGDYTDKLPHICEELDRLPDNTVILAEICWAEYGTNANTVGTILRCLPDKAVQRQQEHKLSAYVFDMLMWGGQDYTTMPYDERLYLTRGLMSISPLYYIRMTDVFEKDFEAAADAIIEKGGEGVVIQKRSNIYMQGTPEAWKTLKLKKKLPVKEYKVVGTIDPKRTYEGIVIEGWRYWADNKDNRYDIDYDTAMQKGYDPITKPYFMKWKNGIVIEVSSDITSDITSGLTDDDRAWLSTEEAQMAIAKGNLWAEVKAMSINDLGRLRHGFLVRLRAKDDGANS